MRCPEVQQKLDLYARQELAPSAREGIEAHLSRCERCRQELGRLRRLEQLLASAPLPPVPQGFAGRVVAQARREPWPVRRPASIGHRAGERFGHRVPIAVGTAAALAAGLLVGSYLGFDTWRAVGRQAPAGATLRADPLAASGFEYLLEPGGDSLAQAYVGLTTATDR